MQKWDDLEEIDGLGEGTEDWEPPQPAGGMGLAAAPLWQAVVCILLFAGLIYLRHTGHPAFGQIAERYRQEAAQEIQLPSWERGAQASPSPSPAPSASPPPSPVGAAGVEVQRL